VKKRRDPLPNQIYLFYGDEDLLISEKVKELKKGISNPSINIEEIEGGEDAKERIISAFQTQPFFGGEKLIIVRNIDLKSKFWGDLPESLQMLSPETKVIFWATGVSKATKIYKYISKVGEVYECRSFTEWEQDQVISWITQKVSSLNKEIDYPAAEALQQICGSGLRKLTSEIDKLVTYIGDRKKIVSDDVFALASPGVMSTFVLSDALSQKNLALSLATLQVLVKHKLQIFPLLGLLASQYRTMLQVKSLGSTARNPMAVAQTLKANPYFVRKCMEKARNFTLNELRNNLYLLQETSLKLKSGETQINTLELLLTSLCGK
jgi:DNA polymerase III subunit delta